jgi:hypothetical protein
LFRESIRITFKLGSTVIKEGSFSVARFNEVLDLQELIEVDNIVIEASVQVLEKITNMPSIDFDALYLYTFEDQNAGIRA